MALSIHMNVQLYIPFSTTITLVVLSTSPYHYLLHREFSQPLKPTFSITEASHGIYHHTATIGRPMHSKSRHLPPEEHSYCEQFLVSAPSNGAKAQGIVALLWLLQAQCSHFWPLCCASYSGFLSSSLWMHHLCQNWTQTWLSPGTSGPWRCPYDSNKPHRSRKYVLRLIGADRERWV